MFRYINPDAYISPDALLVLAMVVAAEGGPAVDAVDRRAGTCAGRGASARARGDARS
jgi:hypothetical protein